MSRQARSNSVHRLPFSEDSRVGLLDLLNQHGLVQNCYTSVLCKKWKAFHAGASKLQNMPVQEVNGPKKRVLVVSISAYNNRPWSELHGPKNDWKFWAMLSLMAGWNVEIVTDSLPTADPTRYPTKDNIARYIKALLRDNKDGDQFVIVYSGHGDTQGLVLADGSHISHQELRSWVFPPLKSGSTLWTFFDCCESSNILGLPQKILCGGDQPVRYQPARGYAGRAEWDALTTLISIGSAAGPSGEMNLTDPKVQTPDQFAHCGPLAWAAYRFFCSDLKESEPLLARFWSSLTGALASSPGQEPQFTVSSTLRNPVLPMLRPLPPNAFSA
ncbi:hypothetical protein FS837_011695 [Tulasnella sp. UAMH 9824]|nr:hypothetical protein FS837_011695 [Tulasnella sp. UAMH 9824]